MGSDPCSHGLRKRFQLARAVPKDILVRHGVVALDIWPATTLHSTQPASTNASSRRHLKPGQGWIEQVEVDFTPRCDDGTLPANSQLAQWYGYLADATQRANRPIAYQTNTRQMLETAGFIDIAEVIIRAPYNSWPADPHQKEVGRWYNLGMTEGLEAVSLAPLTRVYQWNATEHVKPFLGEVKKQICNRKIHAYNNM